jgi:hypothetical protein
VGVTNKKSEISHDLNGNKLTTRWWTCDEADAKKLVRHFHPDYLDPRYNVWYEKIRDAVDGEPVKGILGIVEWVQRELVLAEQRQEVIHAADLFDSWARTRGKGKHKEGANV